jgi:hypothetical protein
VTFVPAAISSCAGRNWNRRMLTDGVAGVASDTALAAVTAVVMIAARSLGRVLTTSSDLLYGPRRRSDERNPFATAPA